MIVAGYRGSNSKIDRCIIAANAILSGETKNKNGFTLYDIIKNKETPFDMSTASKEHIANQLKSKFGVLTCEVHLYHNRWSKALAYFTPSHPNRIYINTAKLGRSDGSVIATIVHEWVHLVDKNDVVHSYGHGSNSRAGKQNTAPYWIDNAAQAIADGIEDYNNNESSKIIYKASVWTRIKRFFRRIF